MSSQLTTILDIIADTAVGGITALKLNQLPETADSWRMPMRMLLPIGGARGAGQLQQVATFKSAGSMVLVVDWTVSDIYLLRAADAGVGLADSADALIGYCAQYMSTIGMLRTPRWSVTGITFPIIGPLEWPAGGRTYDGVQAQITIREII